MIPLSDFTYTLPENLIAQYPLPQRDSSNLLVYNKGILKHEKFSSLVHHLPAHALLVFNNTKVIPARIFFKKETGATIEVFLLEPISPSALLVEAMQAKRVCVWKCTIGNLKRWPTGQTLTQSIGDSMVTATLVNREEGTVEWQWNSDHTFAEIIQLAGQTPLPPYVHREASDTDRERYQTIYSQNDGAVAAPTAGLHFTEEVFNSLAQKNIQTDFITLHVSAGTFQPVKVANALQHTMHHEQVVINRSTIETLLKHAEIIPVGTTSMRTLESLYWYGVKLIEHADAEFDILQQEPYAHRTNYPTSEEALYAILKKMNALDTDTLTGQTSIYILPGYTFKMCQGLITNFHQPGSTLMLLVAAFIGPAWKQVYHEALDNQYRFLSYGDSSLLLP